MNNKLIITGVVCLIVGAAGGYFGSTSLGATKSTAAFTARSGAVPSGAFGAGRGAAGGGLLSGTVAAEDSGSITLDTRDGSSHVVLITPATTVQKSVSGSISDVTTGSTIIVTGTTNSDGSVSAASIQLRPAGSFPTPPAATAPQAD